MIAWIVVGLLAGLLARFFVPGPQPMGCLLTIGLGLAGSLVGGFISSMIYGRDPMDPGLHASGLIMSTVGAVILLILFGAYNRRRLP